jgi:hypothetical protein
VISEAWTKIDEPMMVPTTRAVAVGSPMPRCRLTSGERILHAGAVKFDAGMKL